MHSGKIYSGSRDYIANKIRNMIISRTICKQVLNYLYSLASLREYMCYNLSVYQLYTSHNMKLYRFEN